MTDATIPDDVRRLLLIAIGSIPQLEALLLLHGEPQQSWTAASMAERLYVTPDVAARVLGELAGAGFAARVEGAAGTCQAA